MAKITVKADCGNSPRKEFLKQFHTAMAEGDWSFVADNLSDSIRWEWVGNQVLDSKAVEEQLVKSPLWQVKELVVDAIITHGNEASANGRVVTAAGKTFAFCNVYKFKGFKGTILHAIQTYLIKEQ